jgi:hypothetical protein
MADCLEAGFFQAVNGVIRLPEKGRFQLIDIVIQ